MRVLRPGTRDVRTVGPTVDGTSWEDVVVSQHRPEAYFTVYVAGGPDWPIHQVGGIGAYHLGRDEFRMVRSTASESPEELATCCGLSADGSAILVQMRKFDSDQKRREIRVAEVRIDDGQIGRVLSTTSE